MHELAIMQSVLEVVLDYSGKNQAHTVKQINLAIGSLSDVVIEWTQHYFAMIAQGTIAENAKIKIEKLPAVIQCRNCGRETKLQVKHPDFRCRKCQSTDVQLISGREFRVVSIEVT